MNYVAAFRNCLKIPHFLSFRRLLKYLVVGGPPFAKSFKPQFLALLFRHLYACGHKSLDTHLSAAEAPAVVLEGSQAHGEERKLWK